MRLYRKSLASHTSEILEPRRRQFGVAHRVLNVAVAKRARWHLGKLLAKMDRSKAGRRKNSGASRPNSFSKYIKEILNLGDHGGTKAEASKAEPL